MHICERKLFAYAAGGKDGPQSVGFLAMRQADALRGRRQGATAPPAPPDRGIAPWNPKLMHSCAERLTHMAGGRSERLAAIQILAQPRHAPVPASCGKHHLQGVRGRAAPPAGSATGTLWVLSPLAIAKQDTHTRSDKHHVQRSRAT